MVNSDPLRFSRKGNITREDFLIFNSYRVATAWMGSFATIFRLSIEMSYNVSLHNYEVGSLDEPNRIIQQLQCTSFSTIIDRLQIQISMD